MGKINKETAARSLLLLFICAILIIAAAFQMNENMKNDPFKKKWEQVSLGKTGMTISTPYLLRKNEIIFPDKLKPYVEHAEAYSTFNNENCIEIYASYIKYIDPVRCDLKSGVKNFLNRFGMAAEISDLTISERPMFINGRSGIYVSMKYLFNGIEASAKAIYAVSNSRAWMIVIYIYPFASDAIKQVPDRILRSLTIN